MVDNFAKVILFAGVKGGVGCTAVCSGLIDLVSREEGNVLAVDMAQSGEGDLAVSLGCYEGVKSSNDLDEFRDMNPFLVKGFLEVKERKFGLLKGNSQAIDHIRRLQPFYSYIVIEAGLFDSIDSSLFKIFNKLILVGSPDFSSRLALARSITALKRKKVNFKMVDFVLNHPYASDNFFDRSNIESSGIAPSFIVKKLSSFEQVSRELQPYWKEINLSQETAFKDDGRLQMADNYDFGLDKMRRTKREIQKKFSSSKEMQKLTSGSSQSEKSVKEIEGKARVVIEKILDEYEEMRESERKALINEIIDEVMYMGPLEKYLQDDIVTEVMVNGYGTIFTEKGGVIIKENSSFSDEQNLMTVIERILAPCGRRLDEASPIVDARLSDGSRVHAIISPLALDGPVLTIRKFSKNILSVEDLIKKKALTAASADFLENCVKKRANILVSGGTGTGKTTILNILSLFISENERIVTIEDSAELRLQQPHVVRLESRPPNIEGEGEVTIRELVRASLRMRPDRIVVGECRGAEALDMLQAMNTGHDGSLTTIHANSSRDSISRLETLVLFSGFDLPVRAIREQITSAINIVVQLKRFKDGSRRVVGISEITGMESEVITMQDLFIFEQNQLISTGFKAKVLDE